MNSHPDYGYPWWLTYGHLVVLAVTVAVWAIARWLPWPRPLVIVLAAAALWSAAAFLVVRFALNVNGPDGAADSAIHRIRGRPRARHRRRAPAARP